MTAPIGRKHMLKGLRWSIVEQLGRQLFAMISFLIVARLIGPHEYGKFGLAYAPVALCQGLVSHNLGDQLIHEQRMGEPSGRLADNIFWLSGLAGVALSLMLAAVSAFLLPAEEVADARELLLYLSPICFIIAVTAVPNAILQASFRFRALAGGVFGAGVIASSVSIAMAFAGYGAWSLVVQVLLQQSLIASVTFVRAGWRPGLNVDFSRMRQVLKHGGAAASRNAMQYAEPLIARLLLGPVAGLGTVGYVTMAQRIQALAFQLFALPTARIYFVRWVGAGGHGDTAPFAAAVLMTRLLVVVTPGVLLLSFFARDILGLVLGRQWQAAAPILTLVCLAIIPNVMVYIVHTLARSRDRLAPFLRIQVAQLVGYVVAIWAGLTYGAEVALALGLAANFSGCLLQIRLAVRTLDFPARQLAGGIFRTGAAAMAAAVVLKLVTLTALAPTLRSCVAAVMASCAYAALILIYFPDLRSKLTFGWEKANAA
jgi:PST family polysaccharide transporter